MMSLIQIKNRTGPRTDPWGTPDVTSQVDDLEPSTITCCVSSSGAYRLKFISACLSLE